MRNALALVTAAALAATGVAFPDQRKPMTVGPIFPTRWARGRQLLAWFGFPTVAPTAPYITFITAHIMADSPRLFFSATPIGPTIGTWPIVSFRERISVPRGSVVRTLPAVKDAARFITPKAR